jgi:hypothetical protein
MVAATEISTNVKYSYRVLFSLYLKKIIKGVTIGEYIGGKTPHSRS